MRLIYAFVCVEGGRRGLIYVALMTRNTYNLIHSFEIQRYAGVRRK